MQKLFDKEFFSVQYNDVTTEIIIFDTRKEYDINNDEVIDILGDYAVKCEEKYLEFTLKIISEILDDVLTDVKSGNNYHDIINKYAEKISDLNDFYEYSDEELSEWASFLRFKANEAKKLSKKPKFVEFSFEALSEQATFIENFLKMPIEKRYAALGNLDTEKHYVLFSLVKGFSYKTKFRNRFDSLSEDKLLYFQGSMIDTQTLDDSILFYFLNKDVNGEFKSVNYIDFDYRRDYIYLDENLDEINTGYYDQEPLRSVAPNAAVKKLAEEHNSYKNTIKEVGDYYDSLMIKEKEIPKLVKLSLENRDEYLNEENFPLEILYDGEPMTIVSRFNNAKTKFYCNIGRKKNQVITFTKMHGIEIVDKDIGKKVQAAIDENTAIKYENKPLFELKEQAINKLKRLQKNTERNIWKVGYWGNYFKDAKLAEDHIFDKSRENKLLISKTTDNIRNFFRKNPVKVDIKSISPLLVKKVGNVIGLYEDSNAIDLNYALRLLKQYDCHNHSNLKYCELGSMGSGHYKREFYSFEDLIYFMILSEEAGPVFCVEFNIDRESLLKGSEAIFEETISAKKNNIIDKFN